MPIETYQQALDYWFRRINYEQRGMPADLQELKLDRMRALLNRLGNPEKRLRIVHITGSKGKGSTAAMLATIIQAAGYRTGLFTSPHLTQVEERVQVDGRMIAAGELTALMREIEPAAAAVEVHEGSPPTFFEIITALGFLHFVRRRVELAVVEVGLGGRFDSTNVCRPLLAVITSISLDHVQQLGPDPASIAREKAGIIKPGRPVISGAAVPQAGAVIRQVASERRAPLRELHADFDYQFEPGRITATSWRRPRVGVRTRQRRWPPLALALLGRHQAANAAVAVACVEELRAQGLHLPDKAVSHGLCEVQWPARIEVLSRRPFVILDCAHNVASVQALLETLQSTFPPTRRLLIFAGSRDKDLTGMLALLAPHFQEVFFTRYTSSLRGASGEDLAALWRGISDHPGHVCGDPRAAWQAARSAAAPGDLICITGSIFLAGELRPQLPGDGCASAGLQD
jgi:dihydrofolate synthase/folylpolyglutamate synthase